MSGIGRPSFGRRTSASFGTAPEAEDAVTADAVRPAARDADIDELRALCLARLDPAAVAALPPERLAADVERLIAEIATERRIQLNAREQRELAGELVHDMLGLGPLEPLLEDDSIADIMVNGPNRIFIERHGKRLAVRRRGSATPRISPTSASASPPRSAGASTNRARWSMPG